MSELTPREIVGELDRYIIGQTTQILKSRMVPVFDNDGGLNGFGGILQVDGYAGYNRLIAADRIGPGIQLAHCWAHARRKLIEITRTGPAPIAEEGVALIRDLYAIEAEIRGSLGLVTMRAELLRRARAVAPGLNASARLPRGTKSWQTVLTRNSPSSLRLSSSLLGAHLREPSPQPPLLSVGHWRRPPPQSRET